MSGLTREQILESSDRTTRELGVPEWGGSVHLRTLTGLERDAWEKTVLAVDRKKDYAGLRAQFAALVIGDEKGNRLFGDADVELLGQRNAQVLTRIMDAGYAHNGLSGDAVDEMEGNSESGQSGGSGSA
jgi:hypothetical protein